MKQHTFTDNETWDTGIRMEIADGDKVLTYVGDLDGGTLQIFSRTSRNSTPIPLADAKLSEASLDKNGDAIQQVIFRTNGLLSVVLTGSTAPDVEVTIQ